MDWIGAILERIRTMECPACVKLACTVCGEASIAIVEREAEKAPAFTKDDVLDAHDFLQTWQGPVAELITSA